jgi:NAD+ synthase (glutamine-hydrolysing)
MKIAIAQINPTIADFQGNKRKIIAKIKSALKQKVDLLVFPEMATIGYPPMDLLKNQKLIKDNLKLLKEIIPFSNKMAIVCGYVDFEKNYYTLFNSAAFIYQQKIICKQNKTLLPSYDIFDEQRYFTSGTEYKVVKFLGKKIGLTVCEDIWNNSLSTETKKLIENKQYYLDPVKKLLEKKADFIINLSASPYSIGKRKVKIKMLKRIAAKNSVYLIYANQVGGNDSLIFEGGSLVINPQGEVLGQAKLFKEDLLIVELDKAKHVSLKENRLEDLTKALVLGVRDYVRKCGFKKVLIGLSGGIDSALTTAIAVKALGSQNVLGVTMPSLYSSKGSIDDSKSLAKNLGIPLETIPINTLFSLFKKELKPLFKDRPEDLTEENLQARIRGNLLMSISNKLGYLLLTTGNKSEIAMGYCTLYGDMSGGLAVLSDLPKTLVYKLAREINKKKIIIPLNTINKEPSAELRENQKDQDSLPPYEILDQLLELYIEQKKSKEEIVKEGFPLKLVSRIIKTVNQNEHKRGQAALGLKVTSKSFGLGRRIPIAHKFHG